MKVILEVKENQNPSDNDILIYSSKDKCYTQISKSSFLAKQSNKITTLQAEWEEYQTKVDASLSTMASAIKKLYE